MAASTIIYAAVFVGVLAVVAGSALALMGGRLRAEARAGRRMRALGRSERPDVLEDLRRPEDDEAALPLPWLRRRLVRAGLTAQPAQVLASAAGLSLVAFAGLTALAEVGPAPRLALSVPAGPLLVNAWIGMRVKRRLAAIEEALPDAIELMVRSIRVGHPFSAAVQMVARETEGPLAEELAFVSDEAAYGRDVGEALDEMAGRVGLQDLRFLAVAVTIQSQSGGNLAEVLEGLSRVIRSRFKLFRKVRAITAEAKWSGSFLSGFPVVALIVIQLADPGYFDPVREAGYLMPGLLAVLGFLIANVVVMRRLVDIKV